MNNQMPFIHPYTFPTPLINNNYERLEEKIERLEKNIHILENHLHKLESQIKNIHNDYEESEPTDMYMI